MQLNTLGRLLKYMGMFEKVTIVNSFLYENCNPCLSVWHFDTFESIRKIEKIFKKSPDNNPWWFWQQLWYLPKEKWKSKWSKVMATEIFKAVKNLNKNNMKDIFTPSYMLGLD